MKFTTSISSGTDVRESATTKPQLTSLIDVMTILLVFLLKSFSVEGNLVRPSDDLSLPESRSDQRPQPALNVEITTTGINIDGAPIARITALSQHPDSLFIAPLGTHLQNLLHIQNNNAKEHDVIIQCDKRQDFKIVKKVMYTCAKSHYSNFSLLVLERE